MGIEHHGSGAADPRRRGGRDRVLAVRLRPEELAAWSQAAALAGRPQIAAWVRDVVGAHMAGRKVPAICGDDRLEAIAGELGRQGGNLNQVARALNTLAANGVVDPGEVAGVVAQVEEVSGRVREVLATVWRALDEVGL